MSQPNRSTDLIIERRRLGFYIVAVGTSLFTIDFGRDKDMNPRYRVTHGSEFQDCENFDAALGHCRTVSRLKRKAR